MAGKRDQYHPAVRLFPRLEQALAIAGVVLGQQGDSPGVPPHLIAEEAERPVVQQVVGQDSAAEADVHGAEDVFQAVRRGGAGGGLELEAIAAALLPALQRQAQRFHGTGKRGAQDGDPGLERGRLQVGDQVEGRAQGVFLDPPLGGFKDQEDQRDAVRVAPPEQHDSRRLLGDRRRGRLGACPGEPDAIDQVIVRLRGAASEGTGLVFGIREPPLDGIHGLVQARIGRRRHQGHHEAQVVIGSGRRGGQLGQALAARLLQIGGETEELPQHLHRHAPGMGRRFLVLLPLRLAVLALQGRLRRCKGAPLLGRLGLLRRGRDPGNRIPGQEAQEQQQHGGRSFHGSFSGITGPGHGQSGPDGSSPSER